MCCFSCEVLLHGNCWVYVWWCLCGLKSVCVCQTVLWEREGVKEGGRVYEWEELGRVGEWGSEGVRWRKERREQGRETGCTFNSQTTHVVFSIPLLNWQCFAVKSITTHNLNQTQHAPVHNFITHTYSYTGGVHIRTAHTHFRHHTCIAGTQ